MGEQRSFCSVAGGDLPQ